MAGSRLSVVPLLRGHWSKGLTNDRSAGRPATADWLTRAALAFPSFALFAATWIAGWSLPAAAPLLAGCALLSGATLSAFSAISTLRLRLTDRLDDESLDMTRDALDESVAHILTVSLLAITDSILIVVGMNVAPTVDANGASTGGVYGWWAAAAIGVSTYMALLFILTLPRLYYAYVKIQKVSAQMSGFSSGNR